MLKLSGARRRGMLLWFSSVERLERLGGLISAEPTAPVEYRLAQESKKFCRVVLSTSLPW